MRKYFIILIFHFSHYFSILQMNLCINSANPNVMNIKLIRRTIIKIDKLKKDLNRT